LLLIHFITAYREHTVEGFELDAADYLVMPVTLERFLKAIQKVIRWKTGAQARKEPAVEEPYVYYCVDSQQVKVLLKDIRWIESQKDYIILVLEGGKTLVTYQRISYAEENLLSTIFYAYTARL
jgi:DNA-binding LytR/AlgR family response regulator